MTRALYPNKLYWQSTILENGAYLTIWPNYNTFMKIVRRRYEGGQFDEKEIYLTEVREQPIGIDVRIKVLYDV